MRVLNGAGEILAIQVTDLGKYIVLVESSKEKADDALIYDATRLGEELNKWWLGDAKFFVVILGTDTEIRFERLEEDAT